MRTRCELTSKVDGGGSTGGSNLDIGMVPSPDAMSTSAGDSQSEGLETNGAERSGRCLSLIPLFGARRLHTLRIEASIAPSRELVTTV